MQDQVARAEAGSAFGDWIGRTEVIEETLAPFPSSALAAMLDHDQSVRLGDALPPLAHWLHFLPVHRHSELSEDGHVQRGGFMPPIPLPRRMFAGARITFLQPLRVGETARRTGVISGIVAKHGRSGPLTFVSVKQEITSGGAVSLLEEQDIVYRSAAGTAGAAPRLPDTDPEKEEWGRNLFPDAALLFRYSALLFNAHRIHYDWPYATGEEGYPDTVVHGQLTATALADLALRQTGGTFSSFAYKSISPFFANRPIRLSGRQDGSRLTLWASQAGIIGTRAEATLRQQTG